MARPRRFLHAIAIIAAAITSAAAVDLPEISLMNTLLLWDEGGIAFGDLTFWNRPLLGTVTAIVVDCQFLTETAKRSKRKLTVEGPVYGRNSGQPDRPRSPRSVCTMPRTILPGRAIVALCPPVPVRPSRRKLGRPGKDLTRVPWGTISGGSVNPTVIACD